MNMPNEKMSTCSVYTYRRDIDDKSSASFPGLSSTCKKQGECLGRFNQYMIHGNGICVRGYINSSLVCIISRNIWGDNPGN